MRKETRDKISRLLRDDLDCRKSDLDRVILQGGDGKRELEHYREVLLAKTDFEEWEKINGAG